MSSPRPWEEASRSVFNIYPASHPAFTIPWSHRERSAPGLLPSLLQSPATSLTSRSIIASLIPPDSKGRGIPFRMSLKVELVGMSSNVTAERKWHVTAGRNVDVSRQIEDAAYSAQRPIWKARREEAERRYNGQVECIAFVAVEPDAALPARPQGVVGGAQGCQRLGNVMLAFDVEIRDLFTIRERIALEHLESGGGFHGVNMLSAAGEQDQHESTGTRADIRDPQPLDVIQ